MSKDPRKKLRRLAKELRASEYYGMAGQGAKLADAVLRFLKNEQQTFTPLRERVSTALANGPKTVMEIAINIYGGEEKPYRTPKNTDRAPRVKCADSSGYGKVSHMLWLMGKAGTVERLKAGLYQLKEKTT